MNPFDEETGPQSFSQLLQPQGAQQAAPQVPEGGGLSEVMAPNQPSIFERGRSWAQENPMGAQMLLHTFMRMAQGGGSNLADSIGQGVATGAQAGLFHLAQGKKDQQEAEKVAREQQKEAADRSLRERGVAVNEADLSMRQAEAPVNRKFKQAQTTKLEAETDQSKAQAPLMVETMKAKIAAIQSQIANERDALKSNALKRQLMGLQITAQAFENDVNKEYAPVERETKLTTQQLNNQGQVIQNQAGQQQLDDQSTLTPQERLALGKGGKSGKTEQEDYRSFLTRNIELFTDKDGNIDGSKARKAWQEAMQTPEQAAGNAAASQQKLQAARSAVKVGEIYQGPDGKYYRRGN